MQASTVRKINHIPLVIVFSVVLLLGIVFVILSFGVLNQKTPENFVEVQAEISDIHEYDDGEDRVYQVYVDYSYNGKTYTRKEYGNYDSSMSKGKKVTIYVNPDNPEEFSSGDSDNYIFLIISGIFVGIGAAGLVYNIVKLRKNKRSE